MIPPAKGMVARSSSFIGCPNEASTTPMIVSDQVPSLRNFRIVPKDVIVILSSVIIVVSPYV
jgi:hypothetical protein